MKTNPDTLPKWMSPELRKRLSLLAKRERALGSDWDLEVRQHEIRVATTAVGLARSLGWNDDKCEAVFLAGRYHDIGKMEVDKDALFKPGKLDEAEFNEVKQHALRGVDLLQGVPVPRFLRESMQFHHESYNGTGYNQVKGEDIPYIARLICIADVYDAIKEPRVYKKAVPEHEVLDMMAQNAPFGRHKFDPFLLRAFIKHRLDMACTHESVADPVENAKKLEDWRQVRARLHAFAESDPMNDVKTVDLHIARDGTRTFYEGEGSERKAVAIMSIDGSMLYPSLRKKMNKEYLEERLASMRKHRYGDKIESNNHVDFHC
jgi:putative nucleotidyltransferase with HDIG domain